MSPVRILIVLLLLSVVAPPCGAATKIGALIIKGRGNFRGSTVADLTEIMLASIAAKGSYLAIGKRQLLSKLGADGRSCASDESCLKRVATDLGLAFVVVGTLDKVGTGWRLTVRRAFPGTYAMQTLKYDIKGGLGELIAGVQSVTGRILALAAIRAPVKKQDRYIYLQIVQPGAEVFLNGKLMGRSPLPKLKIVSSQCRLLIRKGGFIPFNGDFKCEDGRTFVITLAKVAPKPIIKIVRPIDPPRYRTKTSPARVGAWVTLGTGLGLVAGGVALLAIANSQTKSLSRQCETDVLLAGVVVCAPGVTETGARSQSSRIKTKQTIGWSLLGVGGAVLTASVVLFFLKPRVREKIVQSPLRVSPLIGAGQIGLSGELRF